MTKQNSGKTAALAVVGTPTLLLAAICAGIWFLGHQTPPEWMLLITGLFLVFCFVVLVG